jgi:AraC-like DNA-binding protein
VRRRALSLLLPYGAWLLVIAALLVGFADPLRLLAGGAHLPHGFTAFWFVTAFFVAIVAAASIERLALGWQWAIALALLGAGFLASDVIALVPESADPPLFSFLTAQARAQLDLLGKNDVIAQVVRAIERRLTSADLGAASIATALATTQRSLQRHLAEAGTSYRDVLAHVRQRRRAELERAGVAEAEIAARLGFANARTMRRSLDDTGPDEDAND